MEALRELIVWPVKYAEQAAALGLSWPRGILLHGPPGCGKTLMVQTVAGGVGWQGSSTLWIKSSVFLHHHVQEAGFAWMFV